MTNKQRRFLKKIYRRGSMSYEYLNKHYPNRNDDFHLGSDTMVDYVESTPNKTGIQVTIKAVEELEDFHRYLLHWRIPLIFSAASLLLAGVSFYFAYIK